MKRRHSKFLTEATFGKVKSLVDMGLKNTQIMSILTLSNGTICAIKRNKDFAAYKAQQKAYFDSKRKALPTATQFNTPVVEEIKTPILDVLVEIRDEIRDLNRLIALSGKAKSFRLF